MLNLIRSTKPHLPLNRQFLLAAVIGWSSFDAGLVDAFHVFNQNPHEYSWWSLHAASRERNKGWRIDYISVTEPLKNKLKGAAILQQVKHSDHCPVMVEMDF